MKQVNKAARAQLAAVGLPGSIAAHDQAHGFPEKSWQKVQAAQQQGGAWATKEKLQQLDSGAARAGELLQALQRELDAEFAESDAFFQQRQQQQGGGNAGGSVPSSREAGAQFQTDLSGYADAYAQARLSDEELRGRLAFSSDDIGGAGVYLEFKHSPAPDPLPNALFIPMPRACAEWILRPLRSFLFTTHPLQNLRFVARGDHVSRRPDRDLEIRRFCNFVAR